MLTLSDFKYHLPQELIAQSPAKPRDACRLMLLDKQTGKIEHKKFYQIIDQLQKGDCLVINNSQVLPARLFGKKKVTEGKIEIFILRNLNKKSNHWLVMLGGRGIKEGLEINLEKNLTCLVLKNNQDSTWEIKFNQNYLKTLTIINKIGSIPLPPYIKQGDGKTDKFNYQTIYAKSQKIGSVAAPTAGLHFTKRLLKKIKSKGIKILSLTLHVGLGTFSPVKVDNIKDHKMHAEWVEIPSVTLKTIIQAKKKNQRIIAVGTTALRALEGYFEQKNIETRHCLVSTENKIKSFNGWINIFIYPGYRFKIINGLITNFHLPCSTLLILVSALAEEENIKKAYTEAIKEKYRFYSYGDAMMIS